VTRHPAEATRLARLAGTAVALALCACGPLGPFAGGSLRGPVHEGAVADWSFAAETEELELETNPASPHSVHTWCAVDGPRLYVPSSMIRGPKRPDEREWIRNVGADPRVRARIDGTVYELQAVRVTDPAEIERARTLLERKYELDPAGRDPEREVWIFRLEPRA
jgi:hypothetical protein